MIAVTKTVWIELLHKVHHPAMFYPVRVRRLPIRDVRIACHFMEGMWLFGAILRLALFPADQWCKIP